MVQSIRDDNFVRAKWLCLLLVFLISLGAMAAGCARGGREKKVDIPSDYLTSRESHIDEDSAAANLLKLCNRLAQEMLASEMPLDAVGQNLALCRESV